MIFVLSATPFYGDANLFCFLKETLTKNLYVGGGSTNPLSSILNWPPYQSYKNITHENNTLTTHNQYIVASILAVLNFNFSYS